MELVWMELGSDRTGEMELVGWNLGDGTGKMELWVWNWGDGNGGMELVCDGIREDETGG